MVKAGKAESVGAAVDKAVETVRRLENRAKSEHQTAAYFKGLSSAVMAEENSLDGVLSAASEEIDFETARIGLRTPVSARVMPAT